MPPSSAKKGALDEGAVISVIGKALGRVKDQAARDRILRWAVSAYGSGKAAPAGWSDESRGGAGGGGKEVGRSIEVPTELDELIEGADPQNQTDRVLVIGSWLQQTKADGFAGQLVNDELKEMGHPIKNITRKMETLIAAKPAALIRQVAKSGKKKQSRKTYKLTDAGQKRVRALLRGEGKSATEADEEE